MGPALAAATLLLAGCGDTSKTADEYLQSAQEHRLAGDLNAAVIELKSALQQNPDSASARFMLGEIYLEIADGTSAEKELLRAAELGMGEGAVALPLARAWLLQRQHDRVLDELPVPAESDPQYALVRVLHGQALLGLGNLDQAEESFNRALEVEPKSLEGTVGLARVAMARDELEAAAELQAKAEAIDSNAIESLSLKGDLAFLRKDYAQAKDVYGTLVARQPQNLMYRVSQAWSQIGAEDYETAAQSIDKILRATPNNSQVTYLRGLAHYYMQEFVESRNMMNRTQELNSNYAPALLISGASSYALEEYEQARNSLARFVGMAPRYEPGRKLLAATQMQLGQRQAAADTLRPLMTSPGEIEDSQTLRLVAAAALQSGDLQSGKNYIEKAVERLPQDRELRAQLGLTRIRLGETEAGLADLEEASRGEGNEALRSRITYAASLLSTEEYEKAIEEGKALQADYPDNTVGYVIEGNAYSRMGDAEKARAAYRMALEVRPDATDAIHNLVASYIGEGDLETASALYEEFLEENPENAVILMEASNLQIRLNNEEKVDEYLTRVIDLRPDAVAPRVRLGLLRLSQGRAADAAALLEEILQDNQGDPAVLEVLGRANIELGNNDAAATYLARLADIRREEPMAHYWYALALSGAGQLQRAQDEINTSLALDDSNVTAKVLKGDIAARLGDAAVLKSTIEDIKDVEGVRESIMFRDLKASLAYLEGRYDDAITLTEPLAEEQPTSQRALRLATLETEAGRPERATGRLESWLKDYPEDGLVRLQLGSMYSNSGRYADAVQEFETLLDQGAESAAVYNNLAWALYEQGKLEDAVRNANKALDMAPDAPAVLDTYGTILLARGDAPKAILYLERAVRADPGAASTRMSLAKSYEEAGRRKDAEKTLADLLRDQNDFPERADARALLDELQAADE